MLAPCLVIRPEARMPFWVFFFAAVICFVLDYVVGLAYVPSGFGILFLIFGLANFFGISISDYAGIVDLLVLVIFAPILVQLFLVLSRQANTEGSGDEAQPVDAGRYRNARRAFQGIQLAQRALPIVKLFLFNLVSGGLVIVSIALLLGLIPPNPAVLTLGFIGGPTIGGFIAEARGSTGAASIVWGIIGGVLGVSLMAGVLAAAVTLHGL
jgi:hypothetical protein